MVYVERVTYDDKRILHFQVSEHLRLTGSKKAKMILDSWEEYLPKFTMVSDATLHHAFPFFPPTTTSHPPFPPPSITPTDLPDV